MFTVRAANEMGGLGAVSNALEYNATGIEYHAGYKEIASQGFFTIDGKKLKSIIGFKGVVIVQTSYTDGSVISERLLKTTY
jgi:hypothetical protein